MSLFYTHDGLSYMDWVRLLLSVVTCPGLVHSYVLTVNPQSFYNACA